MRWPLVAAAALLSCVSVVNVVRADDPGPLNCGVPDNSDPIDVGVATADTVKAALVFVAYPRDTVTSPTWGDSLCANLNQYITAMSHGHQVLNVSAIRRQDDATAAWVAAHSAAWYADHYGSDAYGYANSEIMHAIATAQPNIWAGYRVVFMMHYECPFVCSDTSSAFGCDTTCALGGLTGLNLPDTVAAFHGSGVTMRILGINSINAYSVKMGAELVSAHEYGHLLGFNHSPASNSNASWPDYDNPGRYDIMRQQFNAAFYSAPAIWPYHPLHLYGRGWINADSIGVDTKNVHIHPIRNTTSTILQITAKDTTLHIGPATLQAYQTFVVANFDSLSHWDQQYGGRGLLIWHRMGWEPGTESDDLWDVECASGMFTSGAADPVSGKDTLDTGKYVQGFRSDFWNGVTKTAFSSLTNPSTSLYDDWGRAAAQDLDSSVGIENMRYDAATGDMIVDVYVDPKQYVTVPNGGESWSLSSSHTIQWVYRPYAGIDSVTIYASYNSGSSYTQIGRVANSGSFAWTPATQCTTAKIKVTGSDRTGASAYDESDATFWLDGKAPPTIADLDENACSQNSVTLQWGALYDSCGSDRVGNVAGYEIKYSTSGTITDANWNSATTAFVGVTPLTPTATQTATVGGLSSNTWYYFAVRAYDAAGNRASASNNLHAKTKLLSTDHCQNDNGASARANPGDERPGVVVSFGIHQVAPSPVKVQLRVAFASGSEASEAGLAVYDVSGRRVNTLFSGKTNQLTHAVWNLTNGSGSRVQAGIYWLRLSAGRKVEVKKIIVQ